MITPESVKVGPTGPGTFGTVGAVGRDTGSSPHALIASNRHSPAAPRMIASMTLIPPSLSVRRHVGAGQQHDRNPNCESCDYLHKPLSLLFATI